jgi:hypothetical protein
MGFACLFLLSVFLCVVMDSTSLWDKHRLDQGMYFLTSGGSHSVLLRSDGAAVACGDNHLGQCNIPD